MTQSATARKIDIEQPSERGQPAAGHKPTTALTDDLGQVDRQGCRQPGFDLCYFHEQ